MVYGTVSIIAIAGIVSGLFLFMNISENPDVLFILGINDAPNSIDPLKNPTPKYVNLMVIDQIAEGLFDYNQSDPNTPIVPNLALEGNWSLDHLNYTCILRKNVKFHDGTPFNATAVKWNFDRIYRFIYTMLYDDIWAWFYLYLNPEGSQYINRTEVIDEYTVKFVLNQPYVPLEDLLVLWNSYILSPASTPEDRFIDIKTEKLIGTGPYILDSCKLDYQSESIQTDLHANPDYWGVEPSIAKISFLYCPDDMERMKKTVSGEFSYSMGKSPNDPIWTDQDEEIFEHYKSSKVSIVSKPILGLFYIPMNNNLINETMRKAISYAFNYTEFIETVHSNHAERVKSPIPKFTYYANWENLSMPYYNISMARHILKSANWSGTSNLTINDDVTSGNEWELLATSHNPLSTQNFSVVVGTWSHSITASIMEKNLKQIGVKLNIINMTVVEWWQKLMSGDLEIYIIRWAPSFLDPAEIINPLFSNGIDGEGNTFHFNDTLIQQWMEEAMVEFNKTEREVLYFNIQQRLIELTPVVWLDYNIYYDIWDVNVEGVPIEGAPFKFVLKNAYYN